MAAKTTVTENERRIDQHSQKLMTINTEIALIKQVIKNLSPDFFEKIDRMYKSLEVDNGKASYRTWRYQTDHEIGDIKEYIAGEMKKESNFKLEKKQWIFWGVTMAISILFGAIINHLFSLIR